MHREKAFISTGVQEFSSPKTLVVVSALL